MADDTTVVRSTCPACGTVELAAECVTLLLTGDGSDPRYRYTCPSCFGIVDKPTSAHAVEMLRGAGARLVYVPAEVIERSLAADRLELDDLVAFTSALAQVDDLASVAARGRH